MKYCIVIPHYKHEILFTQFLPKVAELNLPCIVVDDGSGEASFNEVKKLLQDMPNFHFIKHRTNRGKGAAVITGCCHASAMGFTHAVQLDADGQHNIDDVEKLLNHSKANGNTIVSGKPFFDETAPKIRVYGRRITDFWVALETFSFKIKDSLCGFRVYPLAEFENIVDRYFIGSRMDFDTEILVKAVWADIDVHFIPTKVIYHENTVSHFHYLRDNSMLVQLHVRLLFGSFIRSPRLIHNRIKAILSK